MNAPRYATVADLGLEPRYTSVEVMRALRAAGIRTSRERVNMMTDDLFGREEPGTHRRFTGEKVAILLEVFTLIDQVGLPRRLVVALYAGGPDILDDLPDRLKRAEKDVAAAITAAITTVRAGWKEFQGIEDTNERMEAALRIRDAATTLDLVRRLIAA